ncbi:hypothetical protein EAI_05442 [Harpegnathos saltator]|uniref:Complementary sex determiner C-terminal domain-containing protein n=1 Tax=Harpegnathos saltator TaxID=610380 RepID=E2BCX3_HARSA|nr:hypothetical protein EAI_05442 [Harpegnathos saltator]
MDVLGKEEIETEIGTVIGTGIDVGIRIEIETGTGIGIETVIGIEVSLKTVIGEKIKIEKDIGIKTEIGEIQCHIMLNMHQCLFIMNLPPGPIMISPMVTIPRRQVPPLGRSQHPPLMGLTRPFPPRFIAPDMYRIRSPAPNSSK